MKIEDKEVDSIKTLSAFLPQGKSTCVPRLMHTPLLRLLVCIDYYKSNVYDIGFF